MVLCHLPQLELTYGAGRWEMRLTSVYHILSRHPSAVRIQLQTEHRKLPLSQSPPFPFRIKICGLTKPQQAIDARTAGADAIGLNFFEPSIRYVSSNQAFEIAKAVRQNPNTTDKRTPRVVGVFVNHSLDQIIQLVKTVGLDGIQLHGDETVEFFNDLKKSLAEQLTADSQPFFVRALRTQPKVDQPHDRDLETVRITSQIQAWSTAAVDTILLDAAATGEFGGTGKSIDWSLMPQFQAASKLPLALAGGLTPGNVGIAIQTAQTNIVDVASGVESPVGTKCPDLVKQFVQQALVALDV